MTESERVKLLSHELQIDLTGRQLIQSHTPFVLLLPVLACYPDLVIKSAAFLLDLAGYGIPWRLDLQTKPFLLSEGSEMLAGRSLSRTYSSPFTE